MVVLPHKFVILVCRRGCLHAREREGEEREEGERAREREGERDRSVRVGVIYAGLREISQRSLFRFQEFLVYSAFGKRRHFSIIYIAEYMCVCVKRRWRTNPLLRRSCHRRERLVLAARTLDAPAAFIGMEISRRVSSTPVLKL